MKTKKTKAKAKTKQVRVPYDKAWKAVVTDFFSDFILMFMPDLYEQIDFSFPPEFLEQELHNAIKDKTTKLADKLVKVRLKNGKENWILIHIEFETRPKANIGKRMFVYCRLILDKFDEALTAIVVYTGNYVPTVFDRYETDVFGTELRYKFNTFIVKDQNEVDLLNNQNPFALAVLANLYVLKTQDSLEKRLTFKEKLYELAGERNYSAEKTNKLLFFIMELMKLSKELEKEFDNYISKPVNSENMSYITNVTRNHVNAVVKHTYGLSAVEMNAKIKEMDAVLVKTIVSLYKDLHLSFEIIASSMDLETDFVIEILQKKKLIKKDKD